KASVSALSDPETALDDEGRITLMGTIEQEADRLDRFVANLLDLSRIEAGALDLRLAATPLAELIGAVVSRLGTVLADHQIRVAMPEELPLVQIDYLLVDQVVSNLLENAARHGPPGTPIEVDARPVRGWVEVRVRDHGPGIPADQRERIFELFYRFHRANTATRPPHLLAREGRSHVGMGLAICAGVLEAHGGHIWVEQPAGGGATFAFRLPVAAFDAEPV
ncbi:MAG: sensor histidine kinase, partial [Acidimicrobiales bacterium]